MNECRNPSLNNCSRFADCTDLEEGYECRCKTGYHDANPSHPGTVCNYSNPSFLSTIFFSVINECEAANLNDCDKNAECIDTLEGYDCRCKVSFSLSSATIQDLRTLPGIGETKAKEIIRFREVNGSFDEIADLLNIPGIGEKTIEQFLDRITVE